jgi:hypothetical protein
MQPRFYTSLVRMLFRVPTRSEGGDYLRKDVPDAP